MTDRYNGLASPIPDPVPKPETGGQYHGLASGIPADPKAETKTEPTAESNPDTDEKPDKSEPKPNRDGKIPADTTPVPDTAEKPDPKADADGKAKPTAASKFLRAAGIPKDLPRHPIKGMSALVKAQWTAGADISEKLAGNFGAKGAMKTAARLVPGVGAAYSAIQAYQHAKSGDYLGAALNMIGAIPGPIGWVGIAAATAWDMFDLGGGKLNMWSEPDGSATFILPVAAKDIGGVTALDRQLRQAQQCVFSFQDGPRGSVWDSNPPEALRLDGADIEKEVTAALGGIADLFAEVDRVMSSAGEAYFDEYRERLRPHLEAMSQLREQVKPLMTQLKDASDGAATAYTAVLDANRSAREQLVADSKLSDQGPAATFTSAVSVAGSKVIGADQNIANLFGEPAAVLTPAVATGTGTKVDPSKTEQTTPVAQTSAAATPTVTPKAEPTQKKADDPLSDLLRTLTQQKPVSTPTTPSVPNLGTGGLGGGSPLGNTGGSPLSTSPSKPLDTSGDRKLEDSKPRRDYKSERKLAEPEEKKATPLSASQTDNSKTKPESKLTATEKPGNPAVVPARPSAATAAAAAVPAGAAKPTTPGAPPEASKEVDVKGNKTTFPDAKTAKMAQLLANADPAHPLSLTDAAAQAGLTPPVPGQDPGSQVAPAQAKPGDLLVSGDKKFMLLGDGKFYDLQEYKVVSADQLPQDAGSRGGYFHLNDPSPTGAPGSQPVSGQTAGVDQQVPGGTPPPAAPANASPAAPGAPAPGAPAPAPAGGVPSTGTPGAPKPAEGSGPASAEATQTGTAQPTPSPSTTALDPSAVR
ncbi:hypothetical protein BKG58_19740 [Mycobacteroides abscessus subsp. abscessus]|uniref:hypothetical protein n=1 Tax=Mycobacteroides abscessus TaxID=36809 RepID=UPI000926837E|nr:hypothetical protein [Mycobacteroides abscessus]OLT79664.1 hypothetical protein BKG58_19740 [Mycobacteroides abscessus subsp. abscessus]SHP94029.1 Uncharacterised protein [Mycobacteroides abscessus subsp. abscessus]SKO06420.1 Uncharacterised protein [Mycobacteroides abscessus subsp. abscessus]